MKSLKVTIIIPTYNAGLTLKKCLESILSQKFESYEVVIVDGLSTDNTIDIIKHFTDLSNNIRFISEKDKGIYDAMNKGITRAQGEWLYFLGSDDCLIDSSVLSKVAEQFNDDCDLIYGNTIWVPENYIDKGEKSLSQLLQFGINHQRIFYRKSLFDRYGDYNKSYKIAADFDLNIRFFCNDSIKKKYIDCTITKYHSRGISSVTFDDALWSDWRTVIYKPFSSYLSKKEIYTKLRGYSWYVLSKKNYGEATRLFFLIYFNTFSFSYLKQSVSQLIKLKRITN
jgi:glycosyltransferase involved in cell wall biosynthesis